ncbi:hypothetical protein M9H77_06769 [Catharanthus roseus]|uniref:Uncharacterized protein n=1 Tax=Catharanthus roseus TaxID=4058 RepID=A0ACC0BT82_CATRO|nr:hypothetical protein M9H77_06769 [Catharanthus roseus]
MAFFYPLRIYHPRDDYIRCYRAVKRVYIGNPARRDTRTFAHQPAGVDRRMMTSMLQEVDDMTTGVLEGPPSPPTQYASVMRKVLTIICGYMVSIGVQPSHHHPTEPVPECGARGVKRGAHRLPYDGARGGRALAPPHPDGRGRADPDMEEREEEDLADGDVEIHAYMFYLTHSTAQT